MTHLGLSAAVGSVVHGDGHRPGLHRHRHRVLHAAADAGLAGDVAVLVTHEGLHEPLEPEEVLQGLAGVAVLGAGEVELRAVRPVDGDALLHPAQQLGVGDAADEHLAAESGRRQRACTDPQVRSALVDAVHGDERQRTLVTELLGLVLAVVQDAAVIHMELPHFDGVDAAGLALHGREGGVERHDMSFQSASHRFLLVLVYGEPTEKIAYRQYV